MMAKDSVKSRLESGMSFTEFSYQLVQGYDFYHLNKHHNCIVQLGGSDQWGNIVTGTELIRRKGGGEAYAVTTPLIKKADGTKFGKTEGGNVWLDANRTSPYEFYQFWLNASDDDAENYIKIFTLKTQEEINKLIDVHREAPHVRHLQKALAEDITARVHGANALQTAISVTNLLFGKATAEDVESLSAEDFEGMRGAVDVALLTPTEFGDGIGILDALSGKTGFMKSNGEARTAAKQNAIAVNKNKVDDRYTITKEDLLHGKYVLLSKGKKNNYLIVVG
jgi:tyrosyl-tRNA synthetase